MNSRIVVLVSDISTHGGIQRFNRTFCKALNEFAEQHAIEVEVISLHDQVGWYHPQCLSQPLDGCGGDRGRFVRHTLAALAKPHDLVVVGHVDLGPLVLPAQYLYPRPRVLTLTYGIDVWNRLPFHKHAALQRADRIWSISGYTAERLTAVQGIDHEKIQLVPIPLDPDFAAALSTWQATDNRPIRSRLLSISRLQSVAERKGIDAVICALPAIRSQISDVSYVIIGDGNDRPRLEALAAQHGVADTVHFAGRVPDQQLYAYLNGTDVFILPSRTEGFGIVYIEAMACGRAVIAGAHGGSPEVVIDGVTGMLVSHGDSAALTGAITNLLQDEAKRTSFGKAGIERLRTIYDYRIFRATLDQTLGELLAARR
jgi:glycosyltransferase involved in cell wall biosynthesis